MLLTPEEFIRRSLDIPWKRWRGDWLAMDCWGLMSLYCREVLGEEIGSEPKGRFAPDDSVRHGWVRCEPERGAIALMGWRDGAPSHCAVVIERGRRLLQSAANREGVGRVHIASMAAMRRLYPDLVTYRKADAC